MKIKIKSPNGKSTEFIGKYTGGKYIKINNTKFELTTDSNQSKARPRIVLTDNRDNKKYYIRDAFQYFSGVNQTWNYKVGQTVDFTNNSPEVKCKYDNSSQEAIAFLNSYLTTVFIEDYSGTSTNGLSFYEGETNNIRSVSYQVNSEGWMQLPYRGYPRTPYNSWPSSISTASFDEAKRTSMWNFKLRISNIGTSYKDYHTTLLASCAGMNFYFRIYLKKDNNYVYFKASYFITRNSHRIMMSFMHFSKLLLGVQDEVII